MRNGLTAIAVTLLAAACGGDNRSVQPADPAVAPAPSPSSPPAPVRLAFGDCGSGETRFESGPRPVPGQVVASGLLGSASEEQLTTFTGTADFSSGLDDQTVFGGKLGDETGEVSGGLGSTGSGGGGTGWGTIGTGRYGTLGHGSGTGSGYGVGGGRGGMRGRRGSAPQVKIGVPDSRGDLDKNIIRRYIRRSLPKIRFCYEKELAGDPKLRGTVSVKFRIEGTGMVHAAEAEGISAAVATCVAAAIRAIQFPKPKGGGVVEVKYPFTFRPSDDGDSTAPGPPPATADDAGHAEVDEPASGETAPPPGDEPAPPATVPGAGDDNLLRTQARTIEACLRGHAPPYGALVVDLQLDAAGAVTAASVRGVAADVAACVAGAARSIRWPGVTGPRRCPLAFGSLPVDQAPGVDVGATDLRVGGAPVATVAAVVADEAPWRIAALAERLDRDREQRSASAAPVPIVGPWFVRAVDATPMKVINRVLMTAMAGDVDAVLAARTGAGWRSLQPIELPVAPVAAGTGASWSRSRGKARAADAPIEEEERVVASILVTRDRIWVGLSRVSEFTAIPVKDGAHDWATLARVLAEQRHSAFLADRADIEIAGEDDVRYGDLVRTIDAAAAAGFTDWAILQPQALSARPTL